MFAKVDEVKVGDMLQADDGFSCIDPLEIREVKHSDGGLYIECREGHHYLDGQLNSTCTEYLGLIKVQP